MNYKSKLVGNIIRDCVLSTLLLGVYSTSLLAQCNPNPFIQLVPCGSLDTPPNNSTGLHGAVGVTGWALSLHPLWKVEIWRDPLANEGTGLVLVQPAQIIVGSRPDIITAYANYPARSRAGWGTQILTNKLPAGAGSQTPGNGGYRFHAIAYDTNNPSTSREIGQVFISVNNAQSLLPFGSIDTPVAGQFASSSTYVNFGWVLTPMPDIVNIDASGIDVIIDGVPVGHPTYNQFRSDIAGAFPGLNNSQGAVGFYYIDTTAMAAGLHTISWNVFDNMGHGDGIGSRYFEVANPLGLADFTDCIGPNTHIPPYGNVCQLDASASQPGGVYSISQTLVVARSNLTVSGTVTTTGSSDTILRRTSNGYNPQTGKPDMFSIMKLANGVHDVQIQHFLFDGNRCALWTPGASSPCRSYDPNHPAVIWPALCRYPLAVYQYLYNNGNSMWDLDLNPNGGTGQAIVVGVNFQNASTHALQITSNSQVYLCNFTRAANSSIESDWPTTDAEIFDNTIENDGGSGIALAGGATYAYISGNYIYGTSNEMPPGDANMSTAYPGGQIYLNEGSYPVIAVNNFLDGNHVDGSCVGLGASPNGPNQYGFFSHGVEGYAPNNTFQGNTIQNHQASGIMYVSKFNPLNLTVNQINIIQNNGLDGVEVKGCVEHNMSCYTPPTSVNVSNNQILNNGFRAGLFETDRHYGWGVHIYGNASGTPLLPCQHFCDA